MKLRRWLVLGALVVGVGCKRSEPPKLGAVVCWGELGGGALPVPFTVVPDAVDIGFGSGHNCALRPSGQVTC